MLHLPKEQRRARLTTMMLTAALVASPLLHLAQRMCTGCATYGLQGKRTRKVVVLRLLRLLLLHPLPGEQRAGTDPLVRAAARTVTQAAEIVCPGRTVKVGTLATTGRIIVAGKGVTSMTTNMKERNTTSTTERTAMRTRSTKTERATKSSRSCLRRPAETSASRRKWRTARAHTIAPDTTRCRAVRLSAVLRPLRSSWS
mmetsp:Transcript_4614/g.7705  ORF Transcript_4614/g.7705 Transcript_4614/m.7705 type:complete len:200 (-) Transcript_4614:1102-1701(-)